MQNEYRFLPIDSLRGLAAAGIAFFYHYQGFDPGKTFICEDKLTLLYDQGNMLVDFFFVLSGFIFSSFFSETIFRNDISTDTFFRHRISRLYPLHILTLVIVAIFVAERYRLHLQGYGFSNNDGYHFILNLLMLQQIGLEHGHSFNGPSWSISMEFLAYILFFIISKKYFHQRNYLYFTMIVIGLSVAKCGFSYPVLNGSTSGLLIGFFSGCLAAELHKNFKKSLIKMIISYAILTLTIAACYIYLRFDIFGNTTFIFLCIILFPLVILSCLNVPILNKIFSFKPLVYLGDISFSIYMIHYPMQLTFKTTDQYFKLGIDYTDYKIFLLFVFLVLTFSILSYHYFEKPMIKYLRTSNII